MSTTKQMERVKEVVLDLLKQDAKYRDSDRKLCCKVWSIEMGGNIERGEMTAYQFLCEYSKSNSDSKLSNVASIERVRRKLQEEFPELRGKNYKGKKAEEEAVQGFLGYKVSGEV
jgi:hypothetical protein